MTDRWSGIIDCLFLVKPECVNKEKVLDLLRYDHTVDEQVLDNLLIMGVLTLDEYKQHIEKVINDHEMGLKLCRERIKLAEENGKEFNPMVFYCFGSQDLGRAVQSEKDTAWRSGHADKERL